MCKSWKFPVLRLKYKFDDGFFLSKLYKVSAKKSAEELCPMTLKSDSKFKEKLTCDFKHEVKNFVNFYPATQESESFFLMGSFCPKYTRFELEKYRGVIFHWTEHLWKIWVNPDLVLWKMAWAIEWTFIRALKSLKNCTLMDSFCSKHIIFQLKYFTEIMCHDTEGRCKT